MNSFRAWKFYLKFSLPSVSFLTLGKEGLCRVSKKNTLQKIFKFKKFKDCFCMTRWFQNKKLSTIKFHTFWDLKSLFREFFQTRLFKKIKIYNFQLKTRVCMTRWTQIKKLPNTNFHNISRSIEFILVIVSYVHPTWWF